MKKLVTFSIATCFCLSLFAFSPSPTKVLGFSDITENENVYDASEVSSFQEAEESESTADKGTWSKRYRVWTDLTSSSNLNTLETVINNN